MPFFDKKSRRPIPHGKFATGSTRPFQEYLEGETAVEVNSLSDIENWVGHAWLFVYENKKVTLFETVQKSGKMRQPLDHVSSQYKPRFGVDHNLKTYQYQETE